MRSAAISRRGALRTGATVTMDTTVQAATAYVTREPLLAGANPYVTLYDGATPTGYASMWRVDWSTHGTGGRR
ncbi:hypothetical protein ACWEPL_24040 [Nonomuraea sp. NPDC004186]|uniref:hypothetical protein n=1 Tax=Nonomuraea sp. NPDC049625 TaxID=3155775 RepID=UPI00341F647F